MRRRRAWLIAGPAALLLVGTSAPLPPGQRSALARLVVCPDRLADDAARDFAVRRYIAAYARYRPRSHMGERLAFRERVLAAKRCPDTDRQLIHTVPED